MGRTGLHLQLRALLVTKLRPCMWHALRRTYFKCVMAKALDCTARKAVDFSDTQDGDSPSAHAVQYTGSHNHKPPDLSQLSCPSQSTPRLPSIRTSPLSSESRPRNQGTAGTSHGGDAPVGRTQNCLAPDQRAGLPSRADSSQSSPPPSEAGIPLEASRGIGQAGASAGDSPLVCRVSHGTHLREHHVVVSLAQSTALHSPCQTDSQRLALQDSRSEDPFDELGKFLRGDNAL